jgi:hypothetical protein
MRMTDTVLPPLRLTLAQRLTLAAHQAIDVAEEWVANHRRGGPEWQPLGAGGVQWRATARWATVLRRVLPAAPNLTKLRAQQLAQRQQP